MAKSDSYGKVLLERTYIVPLRKDFLRVARYKRAKRALKALKDYLSRHMKSPDVKIGSELNHKVWENGIKNPPHKVHVHAVKYDDGLVFANVPGVKLPHEKTEKKKKKLLDRLKPSKEELAEKPKSADKQSIPESNKSDENQVVKEQTTESKLKESKTTTKKSAVKQDSADKPSKKTSSPTKKSSAKKSTAKKAKKTTSKSPKSSKK